MEDRCVICGEIVPEGTMVCGSCWYKYMGKDSSIVEQTKQNNKHRKSDSNSTDFGTYHCTF